MREVNINWKMLTNLRPDNKADEIFFAQWESDKLNIFLLLGGSISKNPLDRMLQAGRLGTAEEEHAKRGGGGEGESGRELFHVPPLLGFVMKCKDQNEQYKSTELSNDQIN